MFTNDLIMNKFVTILIFLSASSFFNPLGIISPQLSKFIYYVCIILGLFFLKNKAKVNNFKYPNRAFYMIVIGFIGALLMAFSLQDQSFIVSLVAILPYFLAYLSFFVFKSSGIDENSTKTIILGLLICSTIIYIVNYITFPYMIFGNNDSTEIDDSRGVIRIGIQYIDLFILATFYAINQWLLSKKKKWLIIMVICLIMIVLTVTRQVIAVTAILGALFFLKKSKFHQKFIFIILISIFTIYILPEIPIYKTLVETTQNQIDNNENKKEDVRIRAARFYFDEYQTNNITRIFGNGIPSLGNSEWGKEFQRTVYYEYGGNGCFTSDVGWIGFYWHFGLIAVIGVFMLLLKAATIKKSPDHEYLTYYCWAIILLSIMSAPILIYRQVIDIMFVLYLTFAFGRKRSIKSTSYKLANVNQNKIYR